MSNHSAEGYPKDALELERAVKQLSSWVFSWQNEDGGFPPYPSSPEIPDAPVYFESGMLATSDFLIALLRIYPVNEKRLLPEYYVRSWKNAIIKGKSVRQRMADAATFLIKNQLNNGSFPPAGDVFGIRDVGFTDATADAALALLTIHRSLSELFPEKEERKILESVIEKSVHKAVHWLCTTRNKTKIWNSGEEFHKDKARFFPTLLAAIVLDLYADLVDRTLLIEQQPIAKSDLKGILEEVISLIIHEIEKGGYLPFAYSLENGEKQDSIESVVNTCLAISFLSRIIAETGKGLGLTVEVLKSACKKAVDYIKRSREENERILIGGKEERIRKWEATDKDHINLEPILDEHWEIQPFYQATYARITSILSAFWDWIGATETESEKTELLKIINEELSRIHKGFEETGLFYLKEDRGEWVPATSATSMLIADLRRLLDYMQVQYTLD
jgi:hypothetical protein